MKRNPPGKVPRKRSSIEKVAFKNALHCYGSASEMARQFRISRQAIAKWALHGIPSHHVAKVARDTGIPAARLRPDLRLR